MPKPVEVIINAASGLGCSDETREALAEAFSSSGVDANFHFAKTGADIERFAKAACASDAEAIVAGGGDGTISAIAYHVYKAGKTLGVLPLGTLNNFSKDLGIPQEIADAVRVIADGNVETIDLADVNGRVFINNSSIGLYPRIVRRREQQQRLGYGKWRAAFWAALRMFRLSPFLKVRIELDGKSFLRKTPFVFVGNNAYEMDLYNIGRRPSLADGKLSVYFLHRSGHLGVMLLLWHTVTGGVKQWRDFEEVLTDAVTIQTRRKRLPIAFDGEISVMQTPLEFRSIPQALKVLVPKKVEEDA